MSAVPHKSELRKKYLATRDSLTKEYRENASKIATDRLMKSAEFENAKQIFLYYPIKSEANDLPLLFAALSMGKKLAFPKCDPETLTMSFIEVVSKGELARGSYGICEPTGERELFGDENTLCVVPAAVFSKDGYRIGYGKGYYDRFLADFKGISVGFSYDATLVDSLPFDEYDARLDMIITEKGVYRSE